MTARHAVILALLVGCAADSSPPTEAKTEANSAPAKVAVAQLDASSSALREWFAATRGHPRFVMLVSPT